MAAGPWVGAATAAAASAHMAKMQAQVQADQAIARDRQFALPRSRTEPTPAKCACCGSHEFRQHAGRMICTYCRTDGRK